MGFSISLLAPALQEPPKSGPAWHAQDFFASPTCSFFAPNPETSGSEPMPISPSVCPHLKPVLGNPSAPLFPPFPSLSGSRIRPAIFKSLGWSCRGKLSCFLLPPPGSRGINSCDSIAPAAKSAPGPRFTSAGFRAVCPVALAGVSGMLGMLGGDAGGRRGVYLPLDTRRLFGGALLGLPMPTGRFWGANLAVSRRVRRPDQRQARAGQTALNASTLNLQNRTV